MKVDRPRSQSIETRAHCIAEGLLRFVCIWFLTVTVVVLLQFFRSSSSDGRTVVPVYLHILYNIV
jgi:hypothetical protein